MSAALHADPPPGPEDDEGGGPPPGHRSQVVPEIPGLQFERTSLAWERTAIASMVAGVGLARLAAKTSHWTVALAGVVQIGIGGAILLWSALQYQAGHATVADRDLAAPRATRIIGLSTVTFVGFAFALAVLNAVS